MKYLDSNVLIRAITGDIPEQAERALGIIAGGKKGEFVIEDAVLVETTFVLEFREYKMQRADIADALLELSANPKIVVQKESIRSLEIYRSQSKLDFTDCLLAIKAKSSPKKLITFDQDLQKYINRL